MGANDDGEGPAFPVSIPGCGDNGWHGMSLRDWFAGQALAGLSQTTRAAIFNKETARAAYEFADAMIAARAAIAKAQTDPSPSDAESGR